MKNEMRVIQSPRRLGKRDYLNNEIEAALDAGLSVAIITNDGIEIRGFNYAKDITPRGKKIK